MTSIASGMLRDVFGGFVVYRRLIPADDYAECAQRAGVVVQLQKTLPG